MIAEPVAAQRFFKQARLRVGAVEHGRARAGALLAALLHVPGDVVGGEQRFIFAVGSLVVSDPGAALPRRPQPLALALHVVGHYRRGCLQNVFRRAVVLLQADDLRLGKVLLELEDVADIGAAPGIDRLVLVAHRAHIVALAGQQAHDLVLRAVGVLVLVHQQVVPAALIFGAHLGHALQQTLRLQQQIVRPAALALSGQDRENVLAQLVNVLAAREMLSAKEAGA